MLIEYHPQMPPNAGIKKHWCHIYEGDKDVDTCWFQFPDGANADMDYFNGLYYVRVTDENWDVLLEKIVPTTLEAVFWLEMLCSEYAEISKEYIHIVKTPRGIKWT